MLNTPIETHSKIIIVMSSEERISSPKSTTSSSLPNSISFLEVRDGGESSDDASDLGMASMNEEILQAYRGGDQHQHRDMESARASFSITDSSLRNLLLDDSDRSSNDFSRNSLTLEMIYNTPELLGIDGSSSNGSGDNPPKRTSLQLSEVFGDNDTEEKRQTSPGWISPASKAIGSSLSRIASFGKGNKGVGSLPFDETDGNFVDAKLPLHKSDHRLDDEWEGERIQGDIEYESAERIRFEDEDFMNASQIDFENVLNGASATLSRSELDDDRPRSIRFADVLARPMDEQDNNDDDRSVVSLSTYDVFQDGRCDAVGDSKDQSATNTETTTSNEDDSSDVGSDDLSESSKDPEKEKEDELKRSMMYAAFGAGLFAFIGWGFKKVASRLSKNDDTLEAALNIGQEGAGQAADAAISNAVDVADAAREIVDVAQAAQSTSDIMNASMTASQSNLALAGAGGAGNNAAASAAQ